MVTAAMKLNDVCSLEENSGLSTCKALSLGQCLFMLVTYQGLLMPGPHPPDPLNQNPKAGTNGVIIFFKKLHK